MLHLYTVNGNEKILRPFMLESKLYFKKAGAIHFFFFQRSHFSALAIAHSKASEEGISLSGQLGISCFI